MSFLAIVKEVARRGLSSAQRGPELPVQDTGLPYGGRIGSLAQIGEATILVAVTLGSIIDSPKTGEVTIKAISRIRLQGWPEHLALYRYYLATGDGGEKERYIQVMTDHGEPKEVIYFASIYRLFPDSSDTIRFYTGEDEAERIGQREWVFARSDLLTFLNQEQLQALGDKPELVYARAIGDDDYHPPIQGVENRIDDAVGDKGVRQKIWCTPHTRTLDGNIQEHLYVSLEAMDSHDGKAERDVHVDFMVGIPISTNDFRIV
jgi:hypothetical protein